MEQPTRTLRDKILLVLKGLAMGAANKVPGVSGGVVAFVAGFYEEFIDSLRKVNGTALKLLLHFRLKSFWTYINGKFLGLLLLGMLISYFSVSKLLDYFIIHYEVYVWSVFFGMIIGSILYIAKGFEDWNIKNSSIVLGGIIVGVGISLLDPAKENDNLWFVFCCGIIGVSGMTLPGLSGSFILILLGNYVLLLVDSVNALYDTLSDLFRWEYSFIEDPERIRLLKVLTTFSLGSITGLITLSHCLGYLLQKYKSATFAAIIGFITGSLGVVWPWKHQIYKTNAQGQYITDLNNNPILDNYDRYIPNLNATSTYTCVLFIVLGILIVLSLEWYSTRLKKMTL